MSRRLPIVAIDGPAGAGKSTLAAHLARHFGLLNLESGAMYRALALKALDRGVDLDEESGLLRLASATTIILEPGSGEGNRVLLDGADVGSRLRSSAVTAAASRVSVHPGVRVWMVDRQRAMGDAGGVVMEGRDIGTVVFPHAEVKIFLDADPAIRGQRRFQQAGPAHPGQDQMAVEREMRERDERDRNRADSPLRPAADAVTLDTTALSLPEVLGEAERLVKKSMAL